MNRSPTWSHATLLSSICCSCRQRSRERSVRVSPVAPRRPSRCGRRWPPSRRRRSAVRGRTGRCRCRCRRGGSGGRRTRGRPARAGPGTRAGRPAYCASEECGRRTPAAAHAYIVSPEQSKESGPAAGVQVGLADLGHRGVHRGLGAAVRRGRGLRRDPGRRARGAPCRPRSWWRPASAACSCARVLRGGARLGFVGGPALGLDLGDEGRDVALGVGEERLLLVLGARDLVARRVERRLVALRVGLRLLELAARGVELFLGDRQVTDEVVVLVGGRRSVLRTARQLGDVPDVEGVGGSAVPGTDVERGGAAGELDPSGRRSAARRRRAGPACRRFPRSRRRSRAAPGCTARRGRRCARRWRRSSLRAVGRAFASARARSCGDAEADGASDTTGTTTAARRSAARTGRRKRPLRVRANMASQAIGRASAGGGIGAPDASGSGGDRPARGGRRIVASGHEGWSSARCGRLRQPLSATQSGSTPGPPSRGTCPGEGGQRPVTARGRGCRRASLRIAPTRASGRPRRRGSAW